MEGAVALPYALPGMVLGLAMILTWMEPIPGWQPGLYGTVWLILIAYVTRFLILQVKSSTVSIMQVGKEVEEAARINGGGFWTRWRKILVPLYAPGMLTGLFLVFLTAFTELTLSAFTFRLNEYALPVGFVVFLLFFRPVKNIKTKQNSAYLGLAFYLLQLIIPAVEEYIYEYPREVAASSSNMYEVPFTHEWTAIRDRIEIDPRAHLEDFHAEYQKDGEIDRLSYKLVSRSAEGFIHYRIDYSVIEADSLLKDVSVDVIINDWVQ